MTFLVCAPMRLEARALRRGSSDLTVRHTGTGPVRAARAGSELGEGRVVVAGIGGGLATGLEAGDVVVATEIWLAGNGSPPLVMSGADRLAGTIGDLGLNVHTGPVVSSPRIVHGSTRDQLAATGASIVDTESYWMLRNRDPASSWCVRVVADAASRRVVAPATLRAIRVALGRLTVVGAALETFVREVRADGGTAAASR